MVIPQHESFCVLPAALKIELDLLVQVPRSVDQCKFEVLYDVFYCVCVCVLSAALYSVKCEQLSTGALQL